MKRGITVERKYDHNDIPCIVIKKKRGKLALDEIQDILRFEDYQQWNGQYVLFLGKRGQGEPDAVCRRAVAAWWP